MTGYVDVSDPFLPTMFNQPIFMSEGSHGRRSSDVNISIEPAPSDPSPTTPALYSAGTSIDSNSQPNTPEGQQVHPVHVGSSDFLLPPHRSPNRELGLAPSSPLYDQSYYDGLYPSKNNFLSDPPPGRRPRILHNGDVRSRVPHFSQDIPTTHFFDAAPVASPPSAEISADPSQTWRDPSPLSPQSERSSLPPASPYSLSSLDFNSSPVGTPFVQEFSEVIASPPYYERAAHSQPDFLHGYDGPNSFQDVSLDSMWTVESQLYPSPSSTFSPIFSGQATAPALTGAAHYSPVGVGIRHESPMMFNSANRFVPTVDSQLQYGGFPHSGFLLQPWSEGSAPALQVSPTPNFFDIYGNPSSGSINPSNVPGADGLDTTPFAVVTSVSTEKHSSDLKHKEDVYNILLQSSSEEEAAQKVLDLSKTRNNPDYMNQFNQACQHRPKESVTGKAKTEERRTREHKFQCIICGNRMTTNNNLQNHYRSHLSLRKYQCRHCKTFFATDSIKARHLRHTVKCSGYNPNAVPRSKKKPFNDDSTGHGASGSGTQ